jgi:hypothetical protein
MLAILFTIDVIWMPFAVIVAAIAGFSLRSAQIRKYKKQVSSLEREMLNSHAEILNLQSEIVKMQSKSTSKTLVVAMKEMPAATEENTEYAKSATGKK